MHEDYPKTLLELERRFCTEEACVEYLAALRWPGGWACPRCAGADAWAIRRTHWLCGHCRYEMSVTAERLGFTACSRLGQLQDGLGGCCINCAAPWFDPAATGWMALSRWTRPTGEERKPAQSAGGRRKRH